MGPYEVYFGARSKVHAEEQYYKSGCSRMGGDISTWDWKERNWDGPKLIKKLNIWVEKIGSVYIP